MAESPMLRRLREFLLYSGRGSDDGINLRRWFVFFVIYSAVLTAVALGCLHFSGSGNYPLAQTIWLLALYLFYMSLCCTFFPAPTAWLVLLMASPLIGLVKPSLISQYLPLEKNVAQWTAAFVTVVIVAMIGSAGTAIANLNEYHIFTFLLRLGRVYKIRQSRLYQKADHWFSISPFAIMTIASLVPIPVDVVRWLAITHRYRRDHYALASFIGRFVRYGLLAAAATCLRLDWLGIVIIQGSLIVLVLIRYLPRLLAYRKKVNQTSTVISTQGTLS
jgi:membrane protein YqaA with SNARE-associated domain